MKKFLQTFLHARVTAFALMAGGFMLPALVSAQVNAEQVLNIGRNVLSMEDYMLAIQYFNQAIKAKPYMADPYFYRALAKLNLDDYKGAEADCTAALERNKFKTEAYKLRGFARQQMGLDSLAITDYDTGLLSNPYDRYFLYYKGVAETQAGRYPQADSTFNRLLKSHPKFDEGVAARGRLNLLRGDTVAALADADRAIALNRTLLNPWLMKAQIHADRREWQDALKEMDEAILIRPEQPEFYLNRAYMRYNDDNFFGAMADYNYALQIEPEYIPALFNRALLRLEVKDLERSADDFTEVLRLQPRNFHALYNRGLVRLELGQYRKALEDFKAIATQYPRFYPVYYAMAECNRLAGDLRSAASNIHKADNMVSAYVKDPNRNPLDRPAIASGQNRQNMNQDADETENETEVMEQFNRLVTVEPSDEPELAFNERIKGRVQDRNIAVEPEALFTLGLGAPRRSLQTGADTFRELAEFNSAGYIGEPVTLSNGWGALTDNEFAELSEIASDSKRQRPADYFMRAIAMTMLKDYRGAIQAFGKAIEGSPGFTLAYLGKATAETYLGIAENSLDLQLQALRDLDKVIEANPRNPYAWYNKAAIHYSQRDYAEATRALDKAIEIDPHLGAAWFNRGLCRLQAGLKREAFADLSKAGELGVLPSYNLLKRMN